MNTIDNLFKNEITVLNIGAETFTAELKLQGINAIQLDWKPPAGGNPELIKVLDKLNNIDKINVANAKAVDVIIKAHPFLVDIDTAINIIPGMTKYTILHAGPPISWRKMAGPMKGAIVGALIYEGLANNENEASNLAASGKIKFSPCHEHNAVGPMAGILSASMPVQVIENKTHGNFAYCSFNEGLGKVLRFGAYDQEVINKLKWIETEFGPIVKEAIKLSGGIDIRSLIAQAVQMGDECHNRNKAGTSLFVRSITPSLLRVNADLQAIIRVVEFINSNDHFFLNLSMPACKSALDAAHGIENSTVVTTMCRNGVEFGIRVSGCPGNTWFTGPAQMIQGLMFPGYTIKDANPDIGDSAITETLGIGGFAMGGAPAIVQFVGGSVDDALAYSERMAEITLGENQNYANPNLNFRGASTGIDVRKVIASGILPVINTGMAHKDSGIGQVGAGIVNPPAECFEKALLALAKRIK